MDISALEVVFVELFYGRVGLEHGLLGLGFEFLDSGVPFKFC